MIGSGATAATLIPAMAQTAAHVTMLQRSPSYYFAAPTTHELAVQLQPLDLPPEWTHEILRRQYLSQYHWLARTSLDAPDELHAFLIEGIRPLLPEGFDIEKHFTPRYRPWQQRIAIVPDGDFFAALREGQGVDRHRHDRGVHRERASASAPARSSRPTSSSPRPASTCRCSATSRSPSTASRSTSPSASPGAAS